MKNKTVTKMIKRAYIDNMKVSLMKVTLNDSSVTYQVISKDDTIEVINLETASKFFDNIVNVYRRG